MGCIYDCLGKMSAQLGLNRKKSKELLEKSQNETSNQNQELQTNQEKNIYIKQISEVQNSKQIKKGQKQNKSPQEQYFSFNNQYNIDIKSWHDQCEKYDFDLIKLNNCQDKQKNYKSVILFKHTLFYYDEQTLKRSESVNLFIVDGCIYKTQYDDKDYNPKFITQQGLFQVNLQNKEFLLNGEGIEYYGKSRNIKYKGKFQQGKYKEDQQNKNTIINDYQLSRKQSKGIIIIDMDSGQKVNKGQNNRKNQQQIQQLWCKYNQQISINDMNILKNQKWLTSSIIDSYALRLNISSESQYFSKQQSIRKSIKRILFLPSSLTTNFGQTIDDKKAQQLFKQELLEYSEMNFEITKVYKKFGFPVNQNNCHWYFLLFDADSKTVEIFDSTQSSNNRKVRDTKLVNTLFNLLQIQKKEIPHFNQSSGMQKDSYSCGYHVCNFMKYCQEQQFSTKYRYQYQESVIVRQLKETIKQDK